MKQDLHDYVKNVMANILMEIPEGTTRRIGKHVNPRQDKSVDAEIY